MIIIINLSESVHPSLDPTVKLGVTFTPFANLLVHIFENFSSS